MAAAKVRAEENLQEELKKESSSTKAPESPIRSSKSARAKKLNSLPPNAPNRKNLSNAGSAEVQKLKQEVDVVACDCANRASQGATEKALREQLNKEKLNASRKRPRPCIGNSATALRSRRSKASSRKEESLRSRSDEIKSLKTQVASLRAIDKVGSAKERAASLLQQKLKAEKQGLQANDSAVRELEASFTAKIDAHRATTGAKQDLVGNRDTEVAALSPSSHR